MLVGEGLGHFSEDVGRDFRDPVSVLPQKPEDGRPRRRNGYLVNHLCDVGDQILVIRRLQGSGNGGYKGLTQWRFIDLPPVEITRAPQLNEATAD